MNNQKVHCCKMGCKEEAIWHVKWGDKYMDYAHSCNNHILDVADGDADYITLSRLEAIKEIPD